jgi:hypothetical protein
MTTLPSHEVKAHLGAMRRRDAARFADLLRRDFDAKISHLLRIAETSEQRRDLGRLRNLVNDICDKHARKSVRF